MTDTTTGLGRVLRVLGEHGDRLAVFEAAPEQLDEIGQDLDRARRLLAGVRAELAPAGCRQHPGAPVDPTTGGGCLFCATNRRRGQIPDQTPTVPVVLPLDEICEAVAEFGHDEAVRRYGARTVARALLRCRPAPASPLTEESA